MPPAAGRADACHPNVTPGRTLQLGVGVTDPRARRHLEGAEAEPLSAPAENDVGMDRARWVVMGVVGGLANGRWPVRGPLRWGPPPRSPVLPWPETSGAGRPVRDHPRGHGSGTARAPVAVARADRRGGLCTDGRSQRPFGAAIRNADRIVPDLRDPAVGDVVRLRDRFARVIAERGPCAIRSRGGAP